MKTKSISSWGLAADPVSIKRLGESCSQLGHGIAIVCAAFGIYFIVAASLDSVIYGIALFGVAIALDVIIAAHCNDERSHKRPNSHVRSAHARTPTKVCRHY